MMKLSCTSSALGEGSLTDQANLLAECGYEGISVLIDIENWNDHIFGELSNLEKNTGVRVCEFLLCGGAYGRLMDKSAAVREKALCQYKESIKVCNELGAFTEMEYEYGYEGLPLFEPYQVMPEEDEKQLAEIAMELSSYVHGDARLLIEPINRYESRYLNTIKDVDAFLRKYSFPKMGMLADIFHMSIEESNLLNAILSCKDEICHVHLADNNRLTPGEGCLRWPELIRAFKESGYKGYFNLECAITGDKKDKLINAARLLRQWYK